MQTQTLAGGMDGLSVSGVSGLNVGMGQGVGEAWMGVGETKPVVRPRSDSLVVPAAVGGAPSSSSS